MDGRTEAAVQWLLESEEPAIRMMARRDLLGEPEGETEAEVAAQAEAEAKAAASADETPIGPKVNALLSDDLTEHPYRKWTGTHWRLVALAELAVPPGDPRVHRMADRVLDAYTAPAYRKIVRVDGLARRHASIDGNALAACCRIGRKADPRVRLLAELLIDCQWPDGGWNCDPKATRRSSFHETLPAMWGLHEYGHPAAQRGADLLLEHRLFKSPRTGAVINERWLDLRWPPYWHYDILQALVILSRMGRLDDPRAADALDEVERQRLRDGRWRARGYWWRPPGSATYPEAVDWWRGGPSEMVTLNALRVLCAANRL